MKKFVVLGVPTNVPQGTPSWCHCIIYEGDSWQEATRIYLYESSLADGNYRSVRLLCNVNIKLEVEDLQ